MDSEEKNVSNESGLSCPALQIRSLARIKHNEIEGQAMNEQILKRLQDILKIQSAIIEQLEQLGWMTKDLIEDLVLDLNKDSSVLQEEELEKPSETETARAPAPAETAKDGVSIP